MEDSLLLVGGHEPVSDWKRQQKKECETEEHFAVNSREENHKHPDKAVNRSAPQIFLDYNQNERRRVKGRTQNAAQPV